MNIFDTQFVFILNTISINIRVRVDISFEFVDVLNISISNSIIIEIGHPIFLLLLLLYCWVFLTELVRISINIDVVFGSDIFVFKSIHEIVVLDFPNRLDLFDFGETILTMLMSIRVKILRYLLNR